MLVHRMRSEKVHRFGDQLRVNSFYPPFPSPAYERFCQAVIHRRRLPYSTYFAITPTCPYHCAHCSLGHRHDPPMSPTQKLQTIGQIKALGTATLGFTGGEPLCDEQLPDLVAAAKPEMATIVFTTGAGLTDDLAARLRQAGLDTLMIGIESADRATHDATRGVAGSFDAAGRAAAAGQQAGLYTAGSTIATPGKLARGELNRIHALAGAWGLAELRVLNAVPTGQATGCAGFGLSADQRAVLTRWQHRVNRRRSGPAVCTFAHIESPAMFGCGGGYHHLFIDPAGHACPCDLTPLSFGRVTETPLGEIWQTMGEYFSRPRCACLMREMAGRISPDRQLPLDHTQARELVRAARATDPLPALYRRMLE